MLGWAAAVPIPLLIYLDQGWTITVRCAWGKRRKSFLSVFAGSAFSHGQVAESETEFFVKMLDIAVTFQRDAAGTVTGLVLHRAGEDILARKVK